MLGFEFDKGIFGMVKAIRGCIRVEILILYNDALNENQYLKNYVVQCRLSKCHSQQTSIMAFFHKCHGYEHHCSSFL